MREKLSLFVGPTLLVGLLSVVALSFFDYQIPIGLWVFVGALAGFTFIYYTIKQNAVTYVIQRLAEAVMVLFVISTITFLLFSDSNFEPLV